ncbi:hypothetical protein FIBSPDRAFT_715707, partial [Athelia psychrophila]
ANIPTSAPVAGVTPTERQTARKQSEAVHGYNMKWSRRPRYARNFMWDDDDAESVPVTLAVATESMDPLPSPPLSELQNKIALDTIKSYPHLFQIITPIRIQPLDLVLRTHPNRGLVASVLQSFRTGFWPWVNFNKGPNFPSTLDNSHRPLKEPAHVAFVHEQRDKEIAKHRFSEAFGPELLPGMYSIPIGVVPKPHSVLFRLVIDPSDGPYSLNSLISREKVSVPLDNIRHLGVIL